MKIFRASLLFAAYCLSPLVLASAHVSYQGYPAHSVPSQEPPPAMVIVMRHAEKPTEEKSIHLAPAGYRRAQAIPQIFLTIRSGQAPRLPRPDALFATAETKHSNRPYETIAPLSSALHLPINHDYANHETTAIAREVLGGRYSGKVVLICWHHGEIPHLAEALGIPGPLPKWNDEVFDQMWKVEWVDGKAKLTTLPQVLLTGDSTK